MERVRGPRGQGRALSRRSSDLKAYFIFNVSPVLRITPRVQGSRVDGDTRFRPRSVRELSRGVLIARNRRRIRQLLLFHHILAWRAQRALFYLLRSLFLFRGLNNFPIVIREHLQEVDE